MRQSYGATRLVIAVDQPRSGNPGPHLRGRCRCDLLAALRPDHAGQDGMSYAPLDDGSPPSRFCWAGPNPPPGLMVPSSSGRENSAQTISSRPAVDPDETAPDRLAPTR